MDDSANSANGKNGHLPDSFTGDMTMFFSNLRTRVNTQSGFTLIEVLITVAIIGIVAAIAVPAYGKFVTDARRADAISFLSELAGEQQRYFSENNVYAASMSDLGYGSNATASTPEQHYVVSITTPATPTSYVLTATPAADGAQASDSLCKGFVLSSTGAKSNTGSASGKQCW